MDGLECSEVLLSNINLGDRYDAEYFAKEYLSVENALSKQATVKLGKLASTVASAFYPAATQLYSIGDTPFVRCVDCISYPVMTKEQDARFEKIPYAFGKACKGISFLGKEDLIITKVGTPCYATINAEYDEIALSRTVLGLTNIKTVDPYYLMIFLRCKYGFEQLYRQRELTIQYQLTLPRVKNIDVFLSNETFQKAIRSAGIDYIMLHNKAKRIYHNAEQLLLSSLGMSDFTPSQQAVSVKSFSESCGLSGRLDAEYYQPKYAEYERIIRLNSLGFTYVKDVYAPVTTKCDRSQRLYNYTEIGDVDVVTGNAAYNVVATEELPDNAKILTQIGDVLVSTVRPNRGAVAILEENNRLVSGAFTVLRQTADYPKEALQLLLRTEMYRDWLLRYNVGTSYPVIKNDNVLNMPLPIFDSAVIKNAVDKVSESHRLRSKSVQLLEYAKRAVEMAIEQGEDKALEWLKEKRVEC